jgi:gluconate 5-dehydrogenase
MADTPPAERSVAELFDLSGKVAVVTGATGHLGSAMARALAEAGARIVATSRDRSRAESFARTLPHHATAGHIAVELDQTREASIVRAFEEMIDRAGQVDVLVNNAHQALGKDWREVSFAEFAEHQLNSAAYFLLARLVRDHAVQRDASASIVLIGSMYGVVGSYPDAYEDICSASPAAYHALKGGIVHLSRHLAVYWARDGVRVNCLSPGPFPAESAPAEMVERLCTKSPMRRMGHAGELKGAVVFLASDASSYVTGQNLIVDGGWTAW